MNFNGPSVHLRPFVPADVKAFAELAGDRAIADTMISVPHPLDTAAAEMLLHGYAKAETEGIACYFAIALPNAETDLFVGSIALRDIDREHALGELSFWVGRPWWGQGIASRAAELALAIAFDELALNRISAYHMVRNPASGCVLRRLGFHQEGILRQRVRKWGRFEDVAACAMLRSEYFSAVLPASRCGAAQKPEGVV